MTTPTPGGIAIPLGATATTSIGVTRDLTVAHYHPGMPEAYGTPMMVYLMEVAAAEAIQPYLPAEWASVGVARFNARLGAKAPEV